MSKDVVLWQPGKSAVVPSSAKTADDIADYARQLTVRDITQIKRAFEAESYEMVSGFVWSKAMAALKRQLESVGMEFIGEMLRRSDIGEDSSVHEDVTDYEAIQLAEDLGMVNPTDAMRLRQCLETILHFGRRQESLDTDDGMNEFEAMQCLTTCVQSILGHPQVQVAVRFVAFRKDLESRTFKDNDDEIATLKVAPYFVQRTTLNVLLSLIKASDGASLEHSLANINIVLPLIWDDLRKPEKWETGKTYAEIHSLGKKTAIAGLKMALTRVHGFDFVPENLRSNTFIVAAEKVIQAHDEMNNFYNEPPQIRALAELGTIIPIPAFEKCMTAILCVRLGNRYGYSYGAQDSAEQLLNGLSKDRWQYFLEECLPGDRRILYKLMQENPLARWFELVKQFSLDERNIDDKRIQKLLKASRKKDLQQVCSLATESMRSLGYGV